jgi:putative hemolysin
MRSNQFFEIYYSPSSRPAYNSIFSLQACEALASSRRVVNDAMENGGILMLLPSKGIS